MTWPKQNDNQDESRSRNKQLQPYTDCVHSYHNTNVPILLVPICYVVSVEQDYHNINVMLMSLLFGKI